VQASSAFDGSFDPAAVLADDHRTADHRDT
jgi:hypothetical protein